MLLEPTPSPFDLRWRMFGIPVRVHPTFWLFGAILGWNYVQLGFTYVLLWVACMFVSILVHELGHVFMGRACGHEGYIVLYSFGGLAIGNWHHTQRWQRIAISFAGPAAGFALLGLVFLFQRQFLPQIDPDFNMPMLRRAVMMLIFMNLFWNLLNLLPVFPLDGGQIMREICTGIAPRSGLRLSLGLSFVIAGLIAVYSGIVRAKPELPYPPLDPTFNIILFALLAFESLQLMMAVERERRHWDWNDDR
ncbi:MAG: site-2 protease family protein [Gemmataceae bacterium]|nr:site-2 protease family protein [Gemmataceae bacterium]